MTSDQKDNQPSTSGPTPMPPKKQGSSSAKVIAIVIVVVVIVAALGAFLYLSSQPKPGQPTASITNATSVAQYNVPYNITVTTKEKFTSMTFYWGDGSPQTVAYNKSDSVTLSHTYTSPGVYYIYYTVVFSNGNYTSSKELVPVSVSAAASVLPATSSYGDIAIQSSSAVALVNGSWLYPPGTSLSLLLGYFTPPANSYYQVVKQVLAVSLNGSALGTATLSYWFNSSSGSYQLNVSKALYNMSLSQGYYQLALTTYTGNVSSTGAVNGSLNTTTYYTDIPVFSGEKLYTKATSTFTFVNAEAETGGFKTLDPAIEYDTVSYEIMLNTMATLFGYNGSSSSQFFPYLAAYLPTTSNGGINTNYGNYTMTLPSGTSFKEYVQPYENYTIHLRANATFQNGDHVTAWDVAYSLARLLLFDAGAPGTSGWINAQYMLPGNYYASNTFDNITQNITWNNATNNVTIHYQSPMAPSLVFETLGFTSGVQILDANWTALHGGKLSWTPSGFTAYQAHANAGSYISYLVNNVMASGPYMIDYTVPASEVVLIANPAYNPPAGGQEPVPSIKMVIIEYIGQESTRYLQLKSGYAYTGGIPSSDYYLVQNLQKAGTVSTYSFPTISIYWYNINTNINETLLANVYPQANVPQAFFDSVQVRRAFADSYNYAYYLGQQVGNDIYNVSFASGFAGMLPNGMLGYQSNATLQAAGVSLPQFNLTYAMQNWTAFEHSAYFSALGLTVASASVGGVTAGDVLYNGKVLNIPAFVFSADPVDVAGASTWATNLAQIIPGIVVTPVPTSFPTLLGWQVAGQNPAPIYELGWAPDYPYPTDYMGPMAYPSSASFYPGSNGFYPSWFNSSSNPVSGLAGMKLQYVNLTAMQEEYNNGSLTGNPTVALQNFHAMNEMLVNMTFYVYLYQANQIWVINNHITPSTITDYQENVMMGGGGDLMYNYLTLT